MTISNTIRTAGPFIGNGITTAFPFTFKVFKKEEVLAVQTDVATGVALPLVLNSGYSVALNVDQNANPGGTVTTAASLAVGQTLVLTSDLAYLQPLDITNGGGFYPSVLNAALDRLTIFCQQLFSLARRSIKLPLSDAGMNTELPSAVVRANKLLGFDSLGRPIVAAPVSGSAAEVAIALENTKETYLSSIGSSIIGFIQAGIGAIRMLVQDELRSAPVRLEQFGAGKPGVTDAQAWALAAGYASTSNKELLLTRIYNIDTNITLPTDVNVRGTNRVHSGLLFSGTASISLAGTAGTKNAGNQTLSRMLFSHVTSGTVLSMSEFKDVVFDDVEFYHANVAATKFSYLTFLNCVGFDFTITLFNSINQLNESPKFIGGRYSNLNLTISETTDVQISSDFHNLGPSAHISINRGSNPPGLYPVVQMGDFVLDSSDDEALVVVGCTLKIATGFVSGGRTNSKPGVYLVDCKETTLAGLTARYCGASGVQMDSCDGVKHTGCDYNDNQVAGASMTNCADIKYLGCKFANIPGWYGGSYVQQYGIVDTGGNSTFTLLDGSTFDGNAVAPVYLPDVTTEYGINIGLVRATDGTAALVTVAGVANIPHGLAGVPRFASAEALNNGDQKTQITSVDATNIYIRISTASTNANLSGSYTLFWAAKL